MLLNGNITKRQCCLTVAPAVYGSAFGFDAGVDVEFVSMSFVYAHAELMFRLTLH